MTRLYGIILFLIPLAITAQVDKEGMPVSWSLSGEIGDDQDFISLSPPDVAPLLVEDAMQMVNKNQPLRMAYPMTLSLSAGESGQWYNRHNGDRVWQLGLESDGALHLGVVFAFLDIPKGAYIYVYNESHTDFIGPYTSDNNSPDHELVTVPVSGDAIVIEYYEPYAVRGEGDFSISAVNYGYRELAQVFKSPKSCLMPFNEGVPAWSYADDAVMMIISGNGTHVSTGVMLNNTGNNGIPYLLTHSNNAMFGDTENWLFIVSPGGEACGEQSLCWNRSLNGATELVVDESVGIMLLELHESLPGRWHTFFGGWNFECTGDDFTCLQHASGGPLSFSRTTEILTDVAWEGKVVKQVPAWDFGNTFPGSVGAPVINEDGLVVGIFDGGQMDCNGNGYDYFIPLAEVWDDLSTYLDPTNQGDKSHSGAFASRGSDSSGEDQVVLFPNPADDFVNVGGDLTGLQAVKVFDHTGKLVEVLKPEFGRMNVSELLPGVYRLRFDMGGTSRYATLVVQ
ncbi:MAG: T9SS type A sorting domain-containing protein [Flavobacteriales bacterium]|nr:T9SS type A sorting domain-containing protein [Flavobacteriales bacterium]